MDPGRLLIAGAAGVALGGCAMPPQPDPVSGPAPPAPFEDPVLSAVVTTPPIPAPAPDATPEARPSPPSPDHPTMSPIPNPGRAGRADRGPSRRPPADLARGPEVGPPAIAAANAAAREASTPGGFVGGVQVFAYDPGRVYEVWTAPLRVSTITLSPGETVISKAAGDTVRWQIGETQSGAAPHQRTHVMVKPLQRGLETNLVIATSRRVYLLQLRSGRPGAVNTAITWDLAALLETAADATPAPPPVPDAPVALAAPQGPLDANYRIRAKGRRPAWTPAAVVTDGIRTFLRFPPEAGGAEAPALFVRGPDGAAQLVNYRQQGGLWVVDRVLEAAELRIGGRRPQVVRIERVGGAS